MKNSHKFRIRPYGQSGWFGVYVPVDRGGAMLTLVPGVSLDPTEPSGIARAMNTVGNVLRRLDRPAPSFAGVKRPPYERTK